MNHSARRHRVLFVPEAVTLAHVARMVELARSLPSESYDVHLACPPRFLTLFGNLAFTVHDIYTKSPDDFLDALTGIRPIWGEKLLSAYVAAETDLMRQVNPDLVVGDLRISLAVSTRLAQKPFVNVVNAYWSPYARPRFIIPDLTLTRILGSRLADAIYQGIRPLAFNLHAAPLNRVSRRHGLPPVGRNLLEVFTSGDYVIYPDLKGIVPIENLPANHLFLGPINWAPSIPLPSWWGELSGDLPIIYLNLGSSGPVKLLKVTMEALADLPLQVVAAAAQPVRNSHVPDNVRLTDYLPGDLVAARSRLVVCNGGSLASYQALSQGTPVLGLASNSDQLLNMSCIQQAGAGLMLRGIQANGTRIRRAVESILSDSSYQESAKHLSRQIAGSDSLADFRRFVASILPPLNPTHRGKEGSV